MQRCVARVDRGLDVSTPALQQSHDLDVSLAGSLEQWRCIFRGAPVNVGAALQQQPSRVDVAASARQKERCNAALVRPVGLGAIVQEPRYRIDVAALRRSVQREID